MFKSLDISASGMLAERMRLEVISSNMANINNTERVNGEVYRRKQAILTTDSNVSSNKFSDLIVGVKVDEIVEDKSDYKLVYDPEHPDAIQEGELKGYVQQPNVTMAKEMVDMLNAQRGFEANAKTFETMRDIINTSLNIGKS